MAGIREFEDGVDENSGNSNSVIKIISNIVDKDEN
jgi:hypothetical protein